MSTTRTDRRHTGSVVPRSPADAVVALHSLGRRWRGLFAGSDDDEKPDDLAHRPGPDGRSALDHAQHAARSLSLLDRAVEQVLVEDEPMLHPAVSDATRRTWDPVETSVDAAIDELVHQAARLADRAERVPASDWTRAGRVAGADASVTALTVLWDAVDTAIADLRSAESTLRAVRGR